jgi:hypothetical protein
MSDGVLAAMIAAGATVFTSFLQLRTSISKPFTAQSQSAAARRKSRLPLIFMLAMLIGAAVGGFALAQWLHEYERAAQNALQRDLRERIADMSLTRGELEKARAAEHDGIEAELVRRMGTDGVAVLAIVAPCSAPRGATPTALPAVDNTPSPNAPQMALAAAPCSEADAAPITLCATIPATAKLGDVDLYVRSTDSAAPWVSVTAGQETEQARFSEKAMESPDGSAKQVCEGFAQWSERARAARMVVHFAP